MEKDMENVKKKKKSNLSQLKKRGIIQYQNQLLYYKAFHRKFISHRNKKTLKAFYRKFVSHRNEKTNIHE